ATTRRIVEFGPLPESQQRFLGQLLRDGFRRTQSLQVELNTGREVVVDAHEAIPIARARDGHHLTGPVARILRVGFDARHGSRRLERRQASVCAMGSHGRTESLDSECLLSLIREATLLGCSRRCESAGRQANAHNLVQLPFRYSTKQDRSQPKLPYSCELATRPGRLCRFRLKNQTWRRTAAFPAALDAHLRTPIHHASARLRQPYLARQAFACVERVDTR